MLTNDERTVLMIAARGMAMLAIGRWEEPIKAMVAKGYMRRVARVDVENYEITEAGRAVSDAEEDEVAAEFLKAHRMSRNA